MQPQRIIVKTGHHREERWLGMILIGYLLLSIFSGLMFGIAISKVLPGARFVLSILSGLFVLALLILKRGVVAEHRRIIGLILAAFYMLTGILLLFHPYLWIFGIAGITSSLTYFYKYSGLVHNVLTRKGEIVALVLVVVVLVLVMAISNLKHGDAAVPQINEIKTSLEEEIATTLPAENKMLIAETPENETPACTWVETKQVNYETRYLMYFRSVLVKNSTNSTVYDITPQELGFNITNYLDIPIKVKVEYHKDAPWYGISEDQAVTLSIQAATTYNYLDEEFYENSGCFKERCNLTIIGHSLASSVMRTEEVREPVITTTMECQ